MMDVSDGLLRDAGRIARASEVGIAIDSSAVPVHAAARSAAAALGVEALPFALTGGEDHALLAAFPSASSVPPGWEVIGEATDAFAGVRVDGQVPDAVGWDHFTR